MKKFVTGKSFLCTVTYFFYSWVLVPGTAILPNGILAVAYFFTLVYLFLGISIVADVFMA